MQACNWYSAHTRLLNKPVPTYVIASLQTCCTPTSQVVKELGTPQELQHKLSTSSWCVRPHSDRRRQPACQASKSATLSAPASDASEEYGADAIQVLEGLEPVRKRPGMYIGSTGQRGLHHLLYEVLDNAIDEVQAGHAANIDVEIDPSTGVVRITDDGRGIPTSIHPKTGKSALETVLTVLHAGGKFGGDNSGYKVSGGLHGVGISVVNALSEYLEVKVWRAGCQYRQVYSRGAPITSLTEEALPAELADRRGTQVVFRYDHTIFSPTASFDPDTICSRLRELAFLNKAATIRFRAAQLIVPNVDHVAAGSSSSSPATALSSSSNSSGASVGHDSSSNSLGVLNGHHENGHAKSSSSSLQTGHGVSSSSIGTGSSASSSGTHPASRDTGPDWQVFHYEGGLREYVVWLNRDKAAMHEPIEVFKTLDGVTVEVALQWCSDAFSETTVGFANSIRTVDGGTHLEGLRTSLTRTINALAKKAKLVTDKDPALQGDHIREGLGAIVSVKVPNPEFEGQTKTRLGNPEVRKIVDSAIAQALTDWLELHPQALNQIVGKAVNAAKAAEAAKKARELVRRKNVLTKSTLPGKLADCTSDKQSETEIFLVEGDSAGGSAKQARDRRFQAVLPLRGKILNVEKKDDASLYKNNELSNLIVSLGLGPKGEGLGSLRYGKIIILTDADVDGAHIRTLLLTFLFRYRPELFQQGYVYAAVPPLYKVEGPRGALKWCFTDAELKAHVATLPAGSYNIQRFKGLGEMMPTQLWDTTLNPATRLLRRLTTEDVAAASHLFTVLMGDKVAPRRALIEQYGSRLQLADLDI